MNNFLPLLHSIFEEFQKIPKGVLIDRPDELIMTTIRLPEAVAKVTGINEKNLSFSRLSLKHIAEKGKEGRRLLSALSTLLSKPIEIRVGNRDRRFQVVSSFKGYKDGRLHSVVIERNEKGDGIIVTSFQTTEGYLKRYELLWRTAGTD